MGGGSFNRHIRATTRLSKHCEISQDSNPCHTEANTEVSPSLRGSGATEAIHNFNTMDCHEFDKSNSRNDKMDNSQCDKFKLSFLEDSLMKIAQEYLSLENIEWKEFTISEIFTITNAKPHHKNTLRVGEGFTPYITRTSFNNGLEDIVKNENFTLNPKDTITLGAENADFFYQGIEYITGNKMYYLSNENINRYTGLFLVGALQKSIENCGFGYGKGLTGTRLKNRKILLPVNSQNKPNFEFMENFMRDLEQKHLQKIIAYYQNKLLSNGGGGFRI